MAFHGFTDAESALIKQTYIVFYSNTMHHSKAVKATANGMALPPESFTLKTISLFRKEDVEFDRAIRALEAADDLELASMARANMREALFWRGKGGEIDRAVSIWVEKSRGGYTERAKEGKKAEKPIHPFAVVKGKVANGDS